MRGSGKLKNHHSVVTHSFGVRFLVDDDEEEEDADSSDDDSDGEMAELDEDDLLLLQEDGGAWETNRCDELGRFNPQ